jgi:uncharacterized membrane protein
MTETRITPSSTGRHSNLAGALAYVLGLITGVALLVMEKRDDYVRFHAMQSTIVFGGVLVLNFLLLGVPVIGLMLYSPFLLAVFLLWIFLIVQAIFGRRYKLPYVGELAEQQLARLTPRS